MMRDAQRIDHMLGFVRRCLEILDGVDEEITRGMSFVR